MEHKPHGPWLTLSRVGKQYCRSCGLVALNTPLTQWCIKKGCFYDDDPDYKNIVKRLTK